MGRGDDGKMHPTHGWGISTAPDGSLQTVHFLGNDYLLTPAKEALEAVAGALDALLYGRADYRLR